jgi:hypothetical protein
MRVVGIGVCQTRERQHSGNHHIGPRASKKDRAFLLGVPFENRHDEDEALERAECDNCGEKLLSADVAGQFIRMNGKLSGCSGTGLIIWIACLRIAHLPDKRAHSMKTMISSTQSSIGCASLQ